MVPVKYLLAPTLLPTRTSAVVCSKEVVLIVGSLFMVAPNVCGVSGFRLSFICRTQCHYSFEIISLMKRDPVALFKLFSYCHVAVSVLCFFLIVS